MKEALADWELGGIFTYNSGTPTTVINNADPLGLGNGGADQSGPVQLLPGCNPYANYQGGAVGKPQWINPLCYTTPYVPAAAAANLGGYGCAAPPAAGKTAPTGFTNCLNLLPFSFGRNTFNGPHLVNMDFSVHKVFPIRRISEQFNIQFRAEMFNIFNHDNFVPPQPCSGDCNSGVLDQNGIVVGPSGRISGLSGLPREVQMALKVQW